MLHQIEQARHQQTKIHELPQYPLQGRWVLGKILFEPAQRCLHTFSMGIIGRHANSTISVRHRKRPESSSDLWPGGRHGQLIVYRYRIVTEMGWSAESGVPDGI